MSIRPREIVAQIMRAAGLHPALIHAHLKTGLMVGEDSPHTPEERQEWLDACNEWYEQNPEAEDDASDR